MSHRWHLHCVDCKDTHQFHEANRMDREMVFLIKHADAIAALADMYTDDMYTDGKSLEYRWRPDICFGLGFEGRNGLIDPSWFKRHLGHNLMPIDEYGHLLDQCTAYVECVCGSTRRCELAYGHSGDHDPSKGARAS